MLELAGQTITLTGASAQRLAGLAAYAGQEIAIGMRPEAIGGDGTASIDINVDLVEMLGSEKLVHASIGAPSVRSTDTAIETSSGNESTVIASLDPRREIRVGERVSLTLDTLRLHAFDLSTGAAIGRASA